MLYLLNHTGATHISSTGSNTEYYLIAQLKDSAVLLRVTFTWGGSYTWDLDR